MAQRTIARLYDHYDDAVGVVRALEHSGVSSHDISLVGHGVDSRAYDSREPRSDLDEAGSGGGAGAGLTLGTVIGGGAGLLAGIGALAIPGIGPIVAAGWLIAAITGAGVGAAAGGLIGGLTGAGLSEREAHVHAEGVRRGGTLVTVRAEESESARIEAMMAADKAVNLETRATDYASAGWTRFDEDAPAYVTPPTNRTPPVM